MLREAAEAILCWSLSEIRGYFFHRIWKGPWFFLHKCFGSHRCIFSQEAWETPYFVLLWETFGNTLGVLLASETPKVFFHQRLGNTVGIFLPKAWGSPLSVFLLKAQGNPLGMFQQKAKWNIKWFKIGSYVCWNMSKG